MKTLEERIDRLESYEAIRALQARYQRCLDMHDFVGVADCFTDDVVSKYDSGDSTYEGKDEVVEFLKKNLTDRLVSTHHIHGGELDFCDADHATGKWYLEDYLLHRTFLLKLHGAAIYEVHYRREEGVWRIAEIGYERVYEYIEFRPLMNLLTLARRSALQRKFKK